MDTFKACFEDSWKSCQAISMKVEDTEIKAKAFCALGVKWHCYEYAIFQVGKETCDKEYNETGGQGDQASNWPTPNQ